VELLVFRKRVVALSSSEVMKISLIFGAIFWQSGAIFWQSLGQFLRRYLGQFSEGVRKILGQFFGNLWGNF
jgi:hypothetical protein